MMDHGRRLREPGPSAPSVVVAPGSQVDLPVPYPWCDLPARSLAFLRHRLAGHTTIEIARHYRVKQATVQWHLRTCLRRMKRRSPGVRLCSVTDLLVLMAYDRVPRLRLADVPPGRLSPPSASGANGQRPRPAGGAVG